MDFVGGKIRDFLQAPPSTWDPLDPCPLGPISFTSRDSCGSGMGVFCGNEGRMCLGGFWNFPCKNRISFRVNQVIPSLPIDGWNGFVNTWQIVKKMPLIKNARWFKQWPFYTLFRGDDLPLKGSLDNPRKVTKNFSGAGVLLKAAHPDRPKKKQRHTEKICMNITSSFLGLIWTRWCGMFCHLTVLSQGG